MLYFNNFHFQHHRFKPFDSRIIISFILFIRLKSTMIFTKIKNLNAFLTEHVVKHILKVHLCRRIKKQCLFLQKPHKNVFEGDV